MEIDTGLLAIVQSDGLASCFSLKGAISVVGILYMMFCVSLVGCGKEKGLLVVFILWVIFGSITFFRIADQDETDKAASLAFDDDPNHVKLLKFGGYSHMVKTNYGYQYTNYLQAVFGGSRAGTYERIGWEFNEPEYLAMHVPSSDHYKCPWWVYHPSCWIWCPLAGLACSPITWLIILFPNAMFLYIKEL